MNYVIKMQIQPETGEPYNLVTEFEAESITDVIRTIAGDADRHDRNYKELTQQLCGACKHFREYTYKTGENLDGSCKLHSFSEKYPDEYFDTWIDSTCDRWEGNK